MEIYSRWYRANTRSSYTLALVAKLTALPQEGEEENKSRILWAGVGEGLGIGVGHESVGLLLDMKAWGDLAAIERFEDLQTFWRSVLVASSPTLA